MGVCVSASDAASTARDGVGDATAFDRFVEFGLQSCEQMRRGGNLQLQRAAVPTEYIDQAASVIPALVVIYSGCEDAQTSADVRDVTSFGLPSVSSAQKAGGACTNGLLATLQKTPHPTYGEVLLDMRETLQTRGYEQIPQLSSSRQIDMRTTPFSLTNQQAAGGQGKHRAVLVGINYTRHSSGQLNGCVNDVRMMERTLLQRGYPADEMHILTDDPSYGRGMPTRDNIVREFQWLTSGARSEDSLFVHYSGHGTPAGESTDEADGRDEAIVPLDYETAGVITDDMIFQLLVAPLPKGSQLIGLFDCCHSGTIVDLPFIFSATSEGATALQSGEVGLMGANSQFSFTNALKLIAAIAQKLGVFPGARKNAPTNYKAVAASFLSAMAAAA